jgi:arginine N-succinyltransferase
LFIAEFADRFAPKIIAEMRGRLDTDGKSPFWEGLGRHFFTIEYSRADYLTGIGQKAFIAELMPRHPVYTTLLPADARAAIGEVHADTMPARAMLESEGFAARVTSTSSIRARRSSAFATTSAVRGNPCPVSVGGPDPVPDSLSEDVLWLVASRNFAAFRAILCPAPARIAQFPLLPHAAEALGVRAGDSVRAVPLSPRDR